MSEQPVEWDTPPPHLILEESQVHLWLTELVRPTDQVVHLREVLSEDERARADRFHFEKDRVAYTIGRGNLRRLLARYLEVEPTTIRFTYNKYGKPILDVASVCDPAEAGSLAASLQFNVSHSGLLALYGFTLNRAIGVDIEWHRDNISPLEIAKGFFSPSENQTLNGLSTTAEHYEAFYNCWTRKEAYIKAHGMGLSLPLDSFDVTLAPGEHAQLVATRPNADEVNQWVVDAVPAPAGYTAAIALSTTNKNSPKLAKSIGDLVQLSAFRF